MAGIAASSAIASAQSFHQSPIYLLSCGSLSTPGAILAPEAERELERIVLELVGEASAAGGASGTFKHRESLTRPDRGFLPKGRR